MSRGAILFRVAIDGSSGAVVMAVPDFQLKFCHGKWKSIYPFLILCSLVFRAL
ncbi:hypothetical protein D3C80_2231360 [compost metagenome]